MNAGCRHSRPTQRTLRALGALVLCTTAHAVWAEKVLTVCSPYPPEGFDVAIYSGAGTFETVGQTVFNRLFDIEIGGTKILPSLAESYTVSPDGLVWTLHLRHGVKFQTSAWFTPTRELNADDVLFSLKRQFDPNHPWHKLARSGYSFASSTGLEKAIKSIDRVDDYTVTIRLGSPLATLPANLVAVPFSIYSAEYAAQLFKSGRTDDINAHPVGTGPFVLQRYDKDSVLRFSANADYFMGRPKVDRLLMAITTDPAVRAQRLKAGECQIATELKSTDITALRDDPNLVVDAIPALLTDWVALNVSHKPLDNALVRQALNYAVDKDAIVQALFGTGNAVAAVNAIPPTLWGSSADMKGYPHDPEKARALLAKAGFPNGFELTLISRTSGNSAFPNPRAAAEIIQSDLKQVGVTLIIKPYDFGEMLSRTQKGEHDLALQAWNGIADPDSYMTLSSCDGVKGGFNVTRWCDPHYDELIVAARRTADQAARTQLYYQAEALFKDAAVWIPLAYPKLFIANRKNVVGKYVGAAAVYNFSLVDIQ